MALKLFPLRPWEYWRLTPAELGEMLVGSAARDEKEWERAAFIVSSLMNVSGKLLKKPVTVDQLLGRKPKRHEIVDPGLKFDELWRRVLEQRERKARADGDLDR